MDRDTFGERVMWTLVLAAATGAATVLAGRLAKLVWMQAKGRPPPPPISVVSFIGKKTGEGAARSVLH